ncbi:transglutaminase-like domain-containing protein [Pyrococcus kukulkanii]|uniref:transglutaminase-like domain-containing protein n=1 Tax=Pyrococcus kukulkanii TaxID=1609559 RepID=UPI0035643244
MMREIFSAVIIGVLGLLLLSSSSPITLVPTISNELPKKESHSINLRENLYRLSVFNDATVMVVFEDKGRVTYLRQNVYYTYKNGKWIGEKFEGIKVFGKIPVFEPKAPHETIIDRVRVELKSPLLSGNLYTTLYTSWISIPALYSGDLELLRPKRYPVESYDFEATLYEFPDDVLRKAKVPKVGLEVPEVSEKVLKLAKNITKGIESPYEKALAIERYLEENYFYDEKAPPAPPGIDPVEWFLFYSKRGVCLDFNTAFVILARLNGLPARLVTGFKIKAEPGMQEVKLRQAHAWAEVYFEGIGWITFDATGSRRPEEEKEKVQQKSGVREVKVSLGNSTVIELPFKVNLTTNPEIPINITVEDGKTIVNITGEKVGWFNVTLGKLNLSILVGYNTTTKITKWPKEITAGSNFTVEGIVTTTEGILVPAGSVRIELRKEKDSPGKIVGRGEVRHGRFVVKCSATGVAGKYHIVAVYEGWGPYFESTSDPTIVIRDKAKIYVKEFNYTRVGSVKIQGFLGTEGGASLGGEYLEVFLDGKLVGVSKTDSSGRFSFFVGVGNPGIHKVTLVYEGSKGIEGDKKTIVFRAISASITIPSFVYAGDELEIRGKILGASDGTVSISGDFGDYYSKLSENGSFKLRIPVPQDAKGYRKVIIYYGDLKLIEREVYVKQKLLVDVSNALMVVNRSNELTVRITFINGSPLIGSKVMLVAFNETLSNITNKKGIVTFRITPESTGKYTAKLIVITNDGFEIIPIKLRVFRYPLYVYVGLFLLLLSLLLLSAKVIRVKLSFNREPPVYMTNETVEVKTNLPVSLYVNGKLHGRGKEFKLRLNPGDHKIYARFFFFSIEREVKVLDDYNNVIVCIFEECLDGEPSKTAREILGLNDLSLIFEKARYSLKKVSLGEVLRFFRGIRGRCLNEGASEK